MQRQAGAFDARAASVFAGIGAKIAALASAASGSALTTFFVKAADTVSLTATRFESFTGSAEKAQAVMAALEGVAERSRGSFSEVAAIYGQLNVSLRNVGRNEPEILRLTESVQKLIEISGNGKNAAASIEVFQAALVRGEVDARTFRRVVEDFPILLEIIEKQTGKTARQLRIMAEDGKLSAATISGALLNASETIDNRFRSVPETAGKALEDLKNNFFTLTGKIAENAGVSRTWAQAFNDINTLINSQGFKDGLRQTAEGIAKIGTAVSEATKVLADLPKFLDAVFKPFNEGMRRIRGLDKPLELFDPNKDDLNKSFNRAAFIAEWQKIDAERTKGLRGTLGVEEQIVVANREQTKVAEELNKTKREIYKRAVEQLDTLSLQTNVQLAQLSYNEEAIRKAETELAVRQGVSKEIRENFPAMANNIAAQIELNKQLEQTAKIQETNRQAGEDFARAISDGFKSGIQEAKSFGDILKSVAAKLVDIVATWALLKPLEKKFSQDFSKLTDGFDPNAFVGSIFGFAKGGIFDSPVALAGGGGFRGVMAEAGPEGVLPLANVGGKLGVNAAGLGAQQAPPVQVFVDADAAALVKIRTIARQEAAGLAPTVIRDAVNATQSAMVNDGRFGRR